MKDIGGIDQRIGGEGRDPIDFGADGVILFDLPQKQIEVTVTREQYNSVGRFGGLQDVDGNTDIPIPFGGAVAALDIGFELNLKANVPQGILKFTLIIIVPRNRIGAGCHNLTLSADALPKFAVIKLAAIGLAGGVVDVLHIHKNRDFFHSEFHASDIFISEKLDATLAHFAGWTAYSAFGLHY